MAESAKPKPVNKWAERLRGRSRMAVAAIGGMFLLGFLGVSQPLGQRIDTANDRAAKAAARATLASDVANLRRQQALYQSKLPQGIDTADWTNYILGFIRAQRVRLARMEPKEGVTLGPCKVLAWQIEMEGDFQSCAKIVAGLENGERLIRIDRLVLEVNAGRLMMTMMVKGLALDVATKDKPAAGKPAPTVPVHNAGRAAS